MSDDDPLDVALHAMRERVDGASARASTTRTQILERARRDRRSRRRVALVVLPLAAAFAASVAWGAVTGRLSRWIIASSTPPTVPAATADAQSGRAIDPPVASAPLALPEIGDAGAATESVPSTDPAASGASLLGTPSTASPRTPRSPPAVASASSAEQALYATAHRAHFEAHDSAAALRGWDAYLATYPNGHFALEARYNRAICLVRLGRRDEARQALAPFARGDFGGYRQREAANLIDALAPADGG